MDVDQRIVGWISVECGDRSDYRHADCGGHKFDDHVQGDRLQYSDASHTDGESDLNGYACSAHDYDHIAAHRNDRRAVRHHTCRHGRNAAVYLGADHWRWSFSGSSFDAKHVD